MDNNIYNGLDAMILADQYYNNINIDMNENNKNNEIMNNIIKYNSVDCKIMWEIIKILK